MGEVRKDHWYPWFPRDFFADEHVLTMDMECEGAYRRLLDHQWLHGSIPSDLPSLAALCRGVTVARMRKMWVKLSPCFPVDCGDGGRRQNRKMERIREERAAYLAKKSAAGKKGGRPKQNESRPKAQVKQNESTTEANGKPPLPLPQRSGSGEEGISVPGPERTPSGGSAGPTATDRVRRAQAIREAVSDFAGPELVP